MSERKYSTYIVDTNDANNSVELAVHDEDGNLNVPADIHDMLSNFFSRLQSAEDVEIVVDEIEYEDENA